MSANATRWLERALALAALAAIAVVAATMALRAAFPFELEWYEGWSREHVWRLREGLADYVAPSVAFAPPNYPPLFFHVAAWMSRVTGEGFLPLRLTSALASAAAALLVAAAVRRETGRALPALVAAGLFAASAPWHGWWFDIARPDALHTALLVAAVLALRAVRAPLASGVIAGALLALAFFAKQSAAVAVGPLLVLLAFTDPARAAAFAATSAALVLSGLALIERATHGWHGWYVFAVAAGHRPTRALILPTLRGDVAPVLPILLVVGWSLWRAGRRPGAAPRAGFLRSAQAFWGVAAIGPLASSLLLRLYPGGWKNVLLTAAAFIAISAGLALDAFGREVAPDGNSGGRRRLVGAIAMAALLAQFACFASDPRAQWPSHADRIAGERVVEALRALPGGVYVPAHPYLARLAGKPSSIHEASLLDILALDDPRARALEGELREALASNRWHAALVDHSERDEWLYAFVGKQFTRADTLAIPRSAFWCVTGARTRPERLLRR